MDVALKYVLLFSKNCDECNHKISWLQPYWKCTDKTIAPGPEPHSIDRSKPKNYCTDCAEIIDSARKMYKQTIASNIPCRPNPANPNATIKYTDRKRKIGNITISI